jgi:hypothetical protein
LLRKEEDGGVFYGRISRNQLQKTASTIYPVPKVYKGMLKKVVSALEKGDERVLAPLRRIGEHTVAVKNEDLNKGRIHERAIAPSELPAEVQKKPLSSGTLKNPLREAARIYRKDEYNDPSGKTPSKSPIGQKNTERAPRSLAGSSITLTKKDVAGEKARKLASDLREGRTHYAVVVPISTSLRKPRRVKQTIAHTRDWNPDAGVARRTGVSLTYSSKTNEIKCQELGLTSKKVSRSRNMATMTGLSSSRRGGYYSGPSITSSSRPGSNSSSGTISSNRSSSSSSRSSGASSKTTGSSGGGSKKKK